VYAQEHLPPFSTPGYREQPATNKWAYIFATELHPTFIGTGHRLLFIQELGMIALKPRLFTPMSQITVYEIEQARSIDCDMRILYCRIRLTQQRQYKMRNDLTGVTNGKITAYAASIKGGEK